MNEVVTASTSLLSLPTAHIVNRLLQSAVYPSRPLTVTPHYSLPGLPVALCSPGSRPSVRWVNLTATMLCIWNSTYQAIGLRERGSK